MLLAPRVILAAFAVTAGVDGVQVGLLRLGVSPIRERLWIRDKRVSQPISLACYADSKVRTAFSNQFRGAHFMHRSARLSRCHLETPGTSLHQGLNDISISAQLSCQPPGSQLLPFLQFCVSLGFLYDVVGVFGENGSVGSGSTCIRENLHRKLCL